MHAVVITGTFVDRAAAEAELPELIEGVSGMPGFVAGYWVALSGDQAHAMIVFDSEDGAQMLADQARGGPSDAVAASAIQVGEVLRSA